MYIYTISDSITHQTQLVKVESEVKLDVSSYISRATLSTITSSVTQARFRILI